MPQIILNTAGTCRTTGTADPVIIGETGQSGSFDDIADGTEIVYFRRYADSGRAGFENAIGIWRSATGKIERTSVTKSSNAGAAVVWGVGLQIIDVTAFPSMIQKPWWSGKDKIVILVYGDSNAAGSGGSDPGVIPNDDQVFVYATPTGAVPYDVTALAWASHDPDDTLRSAEYASAITLGYTTYTGQLMGSNGNPGWAMGYRLRQISGLPVYVYSSAKGGTTQAFWSTGNGWATLDSQVPAALAAIPGAPTYFDIILGGTGANDQIALLSAEDWYTDWREFRTAAQTEGWWDVDNTQYFHLECPQEATVTGYLDGWPGYVHMVNRSRERVVLLSSAGFEIAPDGLGVHFLPEYYKKQGTAGAEVSAGFIPAQSPVRNNTYIAKQLPVLGGDLDGGGFAINNVIYNGNAYGGMLAYGNVTAEAAVTNFPATRVEACWQVEVPNNVLTVDYNAGTITIPAGADGDYRIWASVDQYTGTASKTFWFAVYANDAPYSAALRISTTTAGGVGTPVNMMGAQPLVEDDVISLKVLSPDGGTSVTIFHATLFIERLGA